MTNFNLTEWTLKHQQLTFFFIILIFAAGIFSYLNLGRLEDPDFTIRQMIVSVVWPGATAQQVEEQVTDKIEKKLQDTPGLDYIKSQSMPGQAIIYVTLKDDAVAEKDIRPTWLEVRNMVNDVKAALPEGVIGPFFNDRFDDVFGNIYAVTGDGFTYEELREESEKIRRILFNVHGIKKVDLIGVKKEKIYIEVENTKLAQLGIPPGVIISSIQSQNAMVPSGMIETRTDNVNLRVTGMFENLDSIRNLPIRANEKTLRLGDIAKIRRGYAEPSDAVMNFNGRPAIALALSMEKGGNILTLGQNLTQTIEQIKKELPVGIEINQVANQPLVVKNAIDEFVKTLSEAVIIVLVVSFISLGFRSGLVIALCIPLVICGVFIIMNIIGISLHKISLGALIIALGLLVDDAIIAVEMTVVKLEQGWDRNKAACFSYTATAMPRLTGALVTCSGFIPVGFSAGAASEFVGSIFSVVTIALLISWFVAGSATPLLTYYLVKVEHPETGTNEKHDNYNTPFYNFFRKILKSFFYYRKTVLITTLCIFMASIFLMKFIKQDFFPASTRPELILDMTLPDGSSLKATEDAVTVISDFLKKEKNIINYSSYTGQSAPRFVLTFEPVLPRTNFAQFIILAPNTDSRNILLKKLQKLFAEEKALANVRPNLKLIQIGPGSAYPVMFRILGYNHEKVKEIAGQVRDVMLKDPKFIDINFDWYEKSKVMHLEIDQDKARLLGVDTKNLALFLQSMLSGASITEFREKDKTINVLFRLNFQDKNNLSYVKNLNICQNNGKYIPLDQIAKINFEMEDGFIARRDLKPTVTIQCNVPEGILGNTAAKEFYESAELKKLKDSLPPGYIIEPDGALELSINATKWLLEPVPVMIIIILILLMFQLQNISKTFLTLLTAPMGIIGVSAALYILDRPIGFVVQLGILALAGIIMRNSVILIDQIDQQLSSGETMWDAIISATVVRFRPILLTALAAILGMIPIIASVFWGPMAVAIAGGLFGATILTLLVLPVMYAAWYRVHETKARTNG
ncbi:MAG: efflux RND transporter permease subunit [Candidatus Wallbacteria bacterium]